MSTPISWRHRSLRSTCSALSRTAIPAPIRTQTESSTTGTSLCPHRRSPGPKAHQPPRRIACTPAAGIQEQDEPGRRTPLPLSRWRSSETSVMSPNRVPAERRTTSSATLSSRSLARSRLDRTSRSVHPRSVPNRAASSSPHLRCHSPPVDGVPPRRQQNHDDLPPARRGWPPSDAVGEAPDAAIPMPRWPRTATCPAIALVPLPLVNSSSEAGPRRRLSRRTSLSTKRQGLRPPCPYFRESRSRPG